MKVFVEHYLRNAAEMAEAVGYVGLPDDIYEVANKCFKQGVTGTHFWSAEGEKIKGALIDIYTPKNSVR
ncbi:MAG: hypothetical protein GY743_19805 [Planctomycetaceae bacterium]|nr:hypothetical protein [Planctomycetaceae bacterium]